MSYRGDVRLGDSLHLKFLTCTAAGVPTTLAGSPVISAYPSNSATQLTAGITLTVDFDSVTGLNHVTVAATTGNGYVTATNYELVVTTGTVGGVSVVGYVIGSFSIENRTANVDRVAGVPQIAPRTGTVVSYNSTTKALVLAANTYACPGMRLKFKTGPGSDSSKCVDTIIDSVTMVGSVTTVYPNNGVWNGEGDPSSSTTYEMYPADGARLASVSQSVPGAVDSNPVAMRSVPLVGTGVAGDRVRLQGLPGDVP